MFDHPDGSPRAELWPEPLVVLAVARLSGTVRYPLEHVSDIKRQHVGPVYRACGHGRVAIALALAWRPAKERRAGADKPMPAAPSG